MDRITELKTKSPRTPAEQAELRTLLDEREAELKNPTYGPMPEPKPEPKDEPEGIDSYNPPAEVLTKAEKKAKAADAELGNG